MTDARDPMPEDDATLLAAELAFGLLEAPERAAAETRAARSPDFAAEVARWQDWAAGLFDREAAPPPPELWRAIQARLPANDDLAPALARWRWATGAALAAAMVLGVVALRPAPVAPPVQVAQVGHPRLAILSGKDQPGTLAVAIDADGRGLTTSAAFDLGQRAAELWVIPAGGKPRSLGVVPALAHWRALPAPLAMALVPGATLAISVEPLGGSPTGQPTGPVIASATISAT